jgi:RHH-type rel operon transcriptional repressor/antitoxin RelB
VSIDGHQVVTLAHSLYRNDTCHYGIIFMASINIRIDDDLKSRSFAELEKLGVTPSELLRQTLQYVADRGRLPFKPMLVTDEDEALIMEATKRLAHPQRVKVGLDDL